MTRKKRAQGEIGVLTDRPALSTRANLIGKSEMTQIFCATGHKVPDRPRPDQEIDPARAKRLEELRAQIRSGRYQPDIRDVAMGLIRDDLSPFA